MSSKIETNSTPKVEVNEQIVSQVTGGTRSAGHICTISGECNGGTSCWPWWADLLIY